MKARAPVVDRRLPAIIVLLAATALVPGAEDMLSHERPAGSLGPRPGEVFRAVAAQLVWTSWSPEYMEGLYLNDRRIFDREGPRYAYFIHRVPLRDLAALKPGENVLKTGLTPKRDGAMVHGMEVNWPGIMVLIQYRK